MINKSKLNKHYDGIQKMNKISKKNNVLNKKGSKRLKIAQNI